MDALVAATTPTTTTANRDIAVDHHDSQFEAVAAETRAVLQSRINSSVCGQHEGKNIT